MNKRNTNVVVPSAGRPKGEQAVDAHTYQQIRQAVKDLQVRR